MTRSNVRSLARGMALVVAATIIVPGLAMAQEGAAAPPPARPEETPPPAPGPSLWVVAGITTLAFSYAPAAMVAATSGATVDRTLFVPVIGPWIDLSQRPSCPGGVCSSDKPAKELLILDGALQAASVAAILFGWVSASASRESASAARSASLRPTIRVSPAPIGSGGHGMVALGTF